jgi:hypothetical protein
MFVAHHRSWLQAVLETCSELKVLVTSRIGLGGMVKSVSEKVFTLGRLPSLAASLLFARRLPRSLTRRELFGEEATRPEESGGTWGPLAFRVLFWMGDRMRFQTGEPPHWKRCQSIP